MSNKLNFTKAAILALPVPVTGRVYHYDTNTRGLAVCISSTGGRVFYSYRKVNNKPERVKLGAFPDLSIEQARDKAAVINSEVALGVNPNDKKRANKAELTLSELFNEYLTRYAIPHGVKTVQDMRDNFARYLGEVPDVAPKLHGKKRVKPEGSVNWQNRKLSTISKLDVQKLHSDLGVYSGNATANRTLELLRAIYNRGITWGLFRGDNPCDGITKFRIQSRDRFIQGDEVARFFNAVAGEPSEAVRDYVLLSLLTGARKANVLSMRWQNINLDRATWFLPDTKNGTSQTIPLTAAAKEVLERRLKSKTSDFVFAGDGATGHMTSPKRAWARILTNAELENLRLHDLRRTLGSWQAATGASLIVIGKTLNHKDVSTTSIYSRLSLDPVRESMETAQAAMLAAGGMLPKAEVLEFKKP